MADQSVVKNTLRFCWKKGIPAMERSLFVRDVLFSLFGLMVEDIFCLQDNPLERGYDLTLHTVSKFHSVYKDYKQKREERLLCNVAVVPLGIKTHRTITVHMYNPHVATEVIIDFLSQYAMVDPDCAVRAVTDKMGIWNGKRDIVVELKEDPGGADGLSHPPAFFNIGGERGYLYYRAQPPFCKKCRAGGHRASACPSGTEPKACHTCGSTTHLLKDCPERGGARGGAPTGRGTPRDNGPPAPHAEGGNKKRPPPRGEKGAPSKTTKVEAGPSSPGGEENVSVTSITSSSSSETSTETSPSTASEASEMEAEETATVSATAPERKTAAAATPVVAAAAAAAAVPAVAPAVVPKRKSAGACRWCHWTPTRFDHEDIDCPEMTCYPCYRNRPYIGFHKVDNCPFKAGGGALKRGKTRLSDDDPEVVEIRFYEPNPNYV